jgi:glucose 1-dehydrogenase
MITGGGSGIGSGIASAYAELGAMVALCDVEYEDVQERAAEIRASGGRVIAVELDVADAQAVETAVAGVTSELGYIDILVNSAGTGTIGSLLEMIEEEWDLVLDVNLKGTFLCTKAVASRMVERGTGGRIINLSSINEELPRAGETNYCASKGGVKMFTRAAALELAPYGINVNAIGPGAIDTPQMQDAMALPELRGEILRRIPFGRYGRVEDVAQVAVFLASELSAWVTGHTLFCDGGMHLVGEQSYLWAIERSLGRAVPDVPICKPPGAPAA